MPASKRRLSYNGGPVDDDTESQSSGQAGHRHGLPPKRQRLTESSTFSAPPRDVLSTLSDELLVRILSHLSEQVLLDVAPVSKRLYTLTSDSQLWRMHYYRRFILPRAHRIPGFKAGLVSSSTKLQYSSQASVWADGGWGRRGAPRNPIAPTDKSANLIDPVDWKKQYKLRHNWARGQCAVEEVPVVEPEPKRAPKGERQTLVKVVDGLAVTADLQSGLRAWDLRTKQPIARKDIQIEDDIYLEPTALAVDGQRLSSGVLDVAVGFEDGTFGIWRLDISQQKLVRLYRQNKSYLGRLVSIAYSYPYVLTAAQLGFVSLYTFDAPTLTQGNLAPVSETAVPLPLVSASYNDEAGGGEESDFEDEEPRFPEPYLLTSLKSRHSQAPLALSIRKMATSAVASIAYTFDAVGGWSIGIQDFDIRPSGNSTPDVVTSRVAYTLPTETRGSASSSPTSSPPRPRSPALQEDVKGDGPVKLCYSHPYLLATLPDNTLVLHLCTSTAASLKISKGIRLWGHTSGISDADITPRGKAVSVSARGDEIRVWELEGRVGGTSVEVKPRQRSDSGAGTGSGTSGGQSPLMSDPEDKKNWVGFDDEMVIVLKEARDGRESLILYDFS